MLYNNPISPNYFKSFHLVSSSITELSNGGRIFNYILLGKISDIEYRVTINTELKTITLLEDRKTSTYRKIEFDYDTVPIFDLLHELRAVLIQQGG